MFKSKFYQKPIYYPNTLEFTGLECMPWESIFSFSNPKLKNPKKMISIEDDGNMEHQLRMSAKLGLVLLNEKEKQQELINQQREEIKILTEIEHELKEKLNFYFSEKEKDRNMILKLEKINFEQEYKIKSLDYNISYFFKEKDTKVINLKKENVDLNLRLKNLENVEFNLNNLNNNYNNLKLDLNSKIKLIENLNNDLDIKDLEIKNLKIDYNNIKDEFEMLESRFNTLERSNRKLKKLNHHIVNINKSLEKENSFLNNDLIEAKNEIKSRNTFLEDELHEMNFDNSNENSFSSEHLQNISIHSELESSIIFDGNFSLKGNIVDDLFANSNPGCHNYKVEEENESDDEYDTATETEFYNDDLNSNNNNKNSNVSNNFSCKNITINHITHNNTTCTHNHKRYKKKKNVLTRYWKTNAYKSNKYQSILLLFLLKFQRELKNNKIFNKSEVPDNLLSLEKKILMLNLNLNNLQIKLKKLFKEKNNFFFGYFGVEIGKIIHLLFLGICNLYFSIN
ncbi:hypothetical protein HK099_002977 [Clydaea vesicula]|uniref:Uncharacterized protein n=1 Tax=Clydaea vesicula TaxID=447962 RepID=A0AAD5U3T4_9FUNG|nr:hypothetical protein HK099_002977 [Clydaea vesicula]